MAVGSVARTAPVTMRHAAACRWALYVTAVVTIATLLLVSHRPSTVRTGCNETVTDTKVGREPAQDIFFLKAHKCASSTVQNVLMRFGYRRGLDFVLPSTNNYLGNPQHFVETMVPQELASPDGRYSIFTHHTRYNRTAVRRVMRPGAKFVTILRDPPDLFESLFSYYHLDKALGQLTLDKLLEDPDNTMLLQRRFSKRIGFNQMSWDLGVEPEDFNDEKKIDALLRTVEEDFDLVMISEHFPTSLVLLADMMGWPLTDVAYFSLNSRPNRAKLRLTEAQRATLAHLNAADSRLYEYFYAKFRKRVFNYGPERMTRDVQELLLLNSRLMSRCLYKKKVGYGQTMALESVGVSDDFDCRYAVKEELQFTEEIRSSQRSRMAQLNRLRALLSNQTADPGR